QWAHMLASDSQCSPICPFRAFTCYKEAIIYRRRGGRVEAFCSWTGDACIGFKCQFAGCSRHALLPDGTCRLKVEALAPAASEDDASIEEEAKVLEKQIESKIRDKIKKFGSRARDLW
ncbi:MAG: hypothetical protein QXR12_06625, partial [Thermofilum sp.]